MAAATAEAGLADRLAEELRRAQQRNVKGWNYLVSVGPTPGVTPKDVVKSRGTLQLYHYRPMVDEIYRVPLLLVMATTNRSYIFDIAPGQSLVEYLLLRGYDVYVLDWLPPRPDESRLRLDDYVLDFIPDCVAEVQKRSGETDISLMGYCMGGVLSLIYAGLHTHGPMKNLICLTTPFNWHKFGLMKIWSDERYMHVDGMVDSTGNVPSDLIMSSFDMLRPATRVAKQVDLWDKIWDDEFVKMYRMMDRWSNETLPLAGEYFRQTTKDLMFANKLYTGELTVGGRRVDLEGVTAAFLHVGAEHDHIVPAEASAGLVERIGSADKENVVFKGGHVSLLAGGNAVRRLWPKLDAWLGARSE